MTHSTRSYALLLLAISYRPISGNLVARASDLLGAVEVSADELCPETVRCAQDPDSVAATVRYST